MSYQVFLTRDAVTDLEELDEFLAVSDSDAKADYVLNKIETILQRLSESPERGTRPRELLEAVRARNDNQKVTLVLGQQEVDI